MWVSERGIYIHYKKPGGRSMKKDCRKAGDGSGVRDERVRGSQSPGDHRVGRCQASQISLMILLRVIGEIIAGF